MRAAAVAIALLFASASAIATAAPSSITGRVTSAGAPAANVTVSVTSTALQGERSTVTTSEGRYWLTALPPGRYDITFSRPKLQTLTRRVLVEEGRVARADAVLEPSEDEESITSTATSISVAETTAITSHVSAETYDRLPIRRDIYSGVALAPGPPTAFGGFLNDAPSFTPVDHGQESLQEVVSIRAALPAEYDGAPPLFLARTRSGGEEFSFALRDAITSGDWLGIDLPGFDRGVEHLVEGNAGGRIVPERLWFFAGAWRGSEALFGDRAGHEAKLTWQAAAAHDVTAFYTDAATDAGFFESDATIAALRYSGMTGPLWTHEAVLSRTTTSSLPVQGPLPLERFRLDSLFAKTSYVVDAGPGDHVLSAGGHAVDHNFDDDAALFVNDRWMVSRFTLNAGARYDDDRITPRVAGTFDLRGNGRQAITASFSEYTSPIALVREATLGFATAIGTTGTARIDAIRRDLGAISGDALQAELRYSLFERFHTGASYTWQDDSAAELFRATPEHTAHAWAGIDLPLGEHEIGVTLLQHYRSGVADILGDLFTSDLALRYSLPVSRTRVTLAADVTDVFDNEEAFLSLGRAFRGWVRVRL